MQTAEMQAAEMQAAEMQAAEMQAGSHASRKPCKPGAMHSRKKPGVILATQFATAQLANFPKNRPSSVADESDSSDYSSVKTIAIDDDLYGHLVTQTQDIGESASSILRRLLGLKEGSYGGQASRRELLEVFDFLGQWEQYRYLTKGRKFLHILAWAYGKHGADFEKVLLVEGSRRKYFARDEKTLLASGSSTNPRPIPDSPFWVITNNSTMKKAEILSEVFRLLGYEPELVQAMLHQCLI